MLAGQFIRAPLKRLAQATCHAQSDAVGVYGQGTDSCADFVLMHRMDRDARYRQLADQYFAMLDET
jgi:hypothetical protein